MVNGSPRHQGILKVKWKIIYSMKIVCFPAGGSRKLSSSQRTARLGLDRLRESKEAGDITNIIWGSFCGEAVVDCLPADYETDINQQNLLEMFLLRSTAGSR